ncbi:MAG TPA: CAP domain-containing protein [Candidatus Limnocylindria bacterium]|nr:CAP domain-containing protein [Candidatus Limnocylindria bacterium]
MKFGLLQVAGCLIAFGGSLSAVELNEAPLPCPEFWTRQVSGTETKAVTGGFVLATSQREQVRQFYLAVHAASDNVPVEWTGDVAAGNAGTTSDAFKDAVIRRVNFFRALAGVPTTVAWDAVYNRKAQKAALMMSANRALNHFPPANWIDYSDEGAEAAHNSNLSLGVLGPAAINSYMLDPGANNSAAGHRRWILYPNTQRMGTGDVPATGSLLSANALWVIDATAPTTRPATRDTFIQWPPPGYLPYTLIPGRWSFAVPNADFSSASVIMTRAGQPLNTTLEPLATGFGDNTLVWIPTGLNPNANDHPNPTNDLDYRVIVQGVKIGGQTRSFTNTVTVFDPARLGPDTVDTRPTGPLAPYAGVATGYAFNSVPGAANYHWRSVSLAPFNKILGAESANDPVTLNTSPGYTPIVQTDFTGGGSAYHFTHSVFASQTLTLNDSFLVYTNSELRFQAFVGLATTTQIARAQVLVNGFWQEVWSQPGNSLGSIPKVVFKPVMVPLTQFAGAVVRVRFTYDVADFYYNQISRGVGFYLDDIALSGVNMLGTATESTTPTNGFEFSAPAVGPYLLQAGPVLFGDYFAGYGTGLEVTAKPGGQTTVIHLATPTRKVDGTVALEFTVSGPTTGLFVLESAASLGSTVNWGARPEVSFTSLGGGRFSCAVPGDVQGFFRVRQP